MIKFTFEKHPDGWDWTLRSDGSTIGYSNKYHTSKSDALKEVKALVANFKKGAVIAQPNEPEIGL
jgi:hypothetical protein